MDKAAFLLPLAPLFASLLSGCFGTSSCAGFKGGTYTRSVELTPEEYASWSMGIPPGGSSGDPTGGGTGGTGGTTGGGTMLGDQEICTMVCESEASLGDLVSCSIGDPDPQGVRTVECVFPQICEGRRHACVRSRAGLAGDDRVRTWLARAAHDEAASVVAFVALGCELAAHGAPRELLAAIEAAAFDEVRHEEAVSALARLYGAERPALTIVDTPVRDLLAIAVENAVEGCVGETWAALAAAHQARRAADPEVRALYAEIAADETRHAELAWALDAWLMGQLGPAARAMVVTARQAAARRLTAVLADSQDDAGLAALGVPDRVTALQLVAGLDAALWSQAA